MTTEEGKTIINDYKEKCNILKQIQSNKKIFMMPVEIGPCLSL